MNYSKIFFSKELDNLQYEDIQTFFSTEREETNTMEFKSYFEKGNTIDRQIDDIAKGICSFLNSEGGILIWGAPVGVKRQGKKEKVFIGGLAPISEIIEQDWLTNKVTSLITPLPSTIRNRILEKEGKHLVIFEIKKSNYSPHQTNNIYYIRLEGQKKPAPHYLIEALFKKITYPNIEGFLNFHPTTTHESHLYLKIDILIANFTELQNETKINYHLVCTNGRFQNYKDPYNQMSNFRWYSEDGHEFHSEKDIKILHHGAPFIDQMTLIFDPTILELEQNTEIALSFGGEKSPFKTSHYIINLKNFKDGKDLIIDKKENKLPSEIRSISGARKEDILSDFLKFGQ